jgi:hypothetical protein
MLYALFSLDFVKRCFDVRMKTVTPSAERLMHFALASNTLTHPYLLAILLNRFDLVLKN